MAPRRPRPQARRAVPASASRASAFALNPTAAAVRMVLLVGVALATLAVTAPAAQAQAAQPAAPARQSFNVPAGPLGPALNAYAAQAGVEMTVSAGLLAGRSSQGLYLSLIHI